METGNKWYQVQHYVWYDNVAVFIMYYHTDILMSRMILLQCLISTEQCNSMGNKRQKGVLAAYLKTGNCVPYHSVGFQNEIIFGMDTLILEVFIRIVQTNSSLGDQRIYWVRFIHCSLRTTPSRLEVVLGKYLLFPTHKRCIHCFLHIHIYCLHHASM